MNMAFRGTVRKTAKSVSEELPIQHLFVMQVIKNEKFWEGSENGSDDKEIWGAGW
ncbi:hypothetical protein [Neobacillus sp. YIM B06451]|uniref:hypothetical protein n=1 Tax=Neobacillus sp. YIM B06451 TaxID=3070994 RepID=UPI00292E8EC2|nr:hypothetical protein [Neobacillus sp. YIM B06451]